ncbi:MAG: aminodeoxyfutalosine deaminase [Verrucomicrobiota bacterium]
MLLRARIVLPVARPPIDDGAVAILAGRIAWVGARSELPPGISTEDELDLGEMALLPGLINAHCHLDYTAMAGQIPPPKRFTDWIQALVALKGAWTIDDYASSWRRGAEMLVRAGVTTVADVEAVAELLPAAWEATPLRVISFRELIHLRERQPAAEVVERAMNDCLGLVQSEGRVGLSPHATYTTTPALLEHAARAAQRRGWRLVTHVAESEEEFEMFMYGQGPMFDWLKHQRDMSDTRRGSPVEHLERCGYLDENLMAIHANHLARHDAGLLSANRVSVVHCPRSHDYFRHLKFPRSELETAGVNICLGTDSLASLRKDGSEPRELSLFAEMQMMAAQDPALSPETILRMATLHGARALGRAGDLGELSIGAAADMIAVPFRGKMADAAAAVIHHSGDVVASMIGGRWVVGPRRISRRAR